MSVPDGFESMRGALDATMGLEILELTAERVVGRMPVEGNTQPMGLWHGGATCVLAETGPFRASRWDHDGAAPRGD